MSEKKKGRRLNEAFYRVLGRYTSLEPLTNLIDFKPTNVILVVFKDEDGSIMQAELTNIGLENSKSLANTLNNNSHLNMSIFNNK